MTTPARPAPKRSLRFLLLCALLGLLLPACTNLNNDRTLYEIDTTSIPKEVAACPDDGWREVDRDGAIWVRFDGPLDVRTVTWSTVLLGSDREHIRGSVIYDAQTYTIRYIPYERLAPVMRYDLYLTRDILDEQGRTVYESQEVKTFRTADPAEIVCPRDPFAPIGGLPLEGEDEGDEEEEALPENEEGMEGAENSEDAESTQNTEAADAD